MLPAALLRLDTVMLAVLGKGYWFNRETAKLEVNPSDSRIYVPNDAVNVLAPQGITKRGRVLYDTVKGQFEFTSPVTVTLRRLLPMEDIPDVAVQYIAARSVAEFQSDYDGDSTKTAQLAQQMEAARRELAGEETRQARYVMGQDNPDLMALRIQMQYNRSRR